LQVGEESDNRVVKYGYYQIFTIYAIRCWGSGVEVGRLSGRRTRTGPGDQNQKRGGWMDYMQRDGA